MASTISRLVGPVRRREAAVLALVCLGYLVRLALAWLSRGSNDAALWEGYAWIASHAGLRVLYEKEPFFNHPPLMGEWASLSLSLSERTWLPFPFLLKLPGILGDLGTGFLLWRIWGRRGGERLGIPLRAWAVLAFALNPVAILVSGYHGNTDSLCAMLGLWAFLLQGRRRPLGAGLALAAALNVKLLPALCVPLLFLQQRTLADARRFSLGLLAGVVPFLPLLVTSGRVIVERTLGYPSNPSDWGLLALLHHSVDLPLIGDWARHAGDAYHVYGRYLLLAIYLGLGLAQRVRPRWTLLELGAIAFAAFLVFAPGFGVHYTVYAVPFLCAVQLRASLVYGLAAGAFAASLYLAHWTGGTPWFSDFTPPFPMPALLLGIAAWVVLAGFLAASVERGLRRRAAPAADG
jgi:hypothetical protein